MSRVKAIVDKVLLTFTSILLTFMVILSVWQVVARYALNAPSTTSEEIIRFLLIWFSLTSAAYVFGQNKHIAILFIREKFNNNTVRMAIEKFSDIILLIVSFALMLWGGIKVVSLTLTQVAPSTGVSMAVMYVALPVAGLFVAFYAIYNLTTKDSSATEDGSDKS